MISRQVDQSKAAAILMIAGITAVVLSASAANVSAFTLIAVGEAGKIAHSPDSGSNWFARTSGTNEYLWSMD